MSAGAEVSRNFSYFRRLNELNYGILHVCVKKTATIYERTQKESKTMIYKVYYQENVLEIPVRENTKSLYLEADSEREVRAKLKDFNYNIEFVQLLEGEYLAHEQESTNFVLESL